MSGLTSWLLTYLLHSSVLLAGAALVCFILRDRRLGLQEAVLRAALVGGFLTASLQLGLGVHPLGGVLTVPDDTPASRPAAEEVFFGPLPAVLEEVGSRAAAVPTAPAGWALPSPEVWRPILVGVWTVIALIALARLAVAAVRLRRMLRPRHRVAGDGLAARVAALAAGLGLRRPVPLSTAPRLEVPLATGVLRPEVCLPPRALSELGSEQQVALCAHELAHVARRDPAWVLLARLVEAVAPLQPLNTWARRRLQDLAECLSDDLAVAASGRPEGLARSLVDVASWTVADGIFLPAAAAGALSSRSRLGHRVERLMDPLRSLERPGRLLLPLAGAVVLATALVTPAISDSSVPEAVPAAPTAPEAPLAPEPPVPPEAPEAPQAPEAPEAPSAPQAPEAPSAPEAPEEPESEAARELEELTRRISERAELHSAEMEGVGEEIERIVAANMPPEEEMERLGAELESAARTLAEAHQAEHEGGEPPSEEELARAREEMKAAHQKMREAMGELRVPNSELRALQEKAREMARAATPTPEERRRLKELTREIVEESMPDLDELREQMKQMKEISRTIDQEAMEQIRESMMVVRQTLRETMPQMRAEALTALEAAREQTLDEAERRHLDEAPESPES